MNGYRFSDQDAAGLARSAVSFNGCGALLIPPFAAIGGNSSDPLRGVAAGLVALHVRGMASLATKAHAGLAFVLTLKPRFDFKVRRAFSAFVNIALDDVNRLCLFAGERIGWTQPGAPLIPYLVIARHCSHGHVPRSAAGLATKPGTFLSIGLHLKRARTDFTSLCNHASILLRNNRHCQIERAQAQGQMFPPEQVKQVQEALI
jgi:hypothetical protein